MATYADRARLRIKIKTLAAEARFIKREKSRVWKQRDPQGELRMSLDRHRTQFVRPEARHSQLAYGFIRGRAYRDMERTCRELPNFEAVKKIAARFGGDMDAFTAWSTVE